ncbi:unnamed protein product [Prorocentrum cordatum]|uniref:Uncharacterized protein n=1 Tax=Prorocentrum cordatum TaxID=2364126 RepID=A0ABN9U4T8_9DINO|nr:unnamed protein product [Polarella glacialis]
MGTKRAGDAGIPSPAKKAAAAAASPAAAFGAPPAAASGAPPAAASGAPPAAASGAPPALRIADGPVDAAGSLKHHVDHSLLSFLGQRKREVSFAVPAKCSFIPPLAITDAANLSSFREVMDDDNLVASFSRTKEYEAAGAGWMLDPICSDIDDVSASQLEGAVGVRSEEAHSLSPKHAASRRLSFDAPIPAMVVDVKVAQRFEPNRPGVCVTEALAVLAGRAVVIAWRAAMSEALQQSNEDRVWHLFNAALSVPIRMRLLPDGDATHLAALAFSEKMFSAYAASGAESFWRVENCFAKQEPVSKLEAALKAYGLQFKGKACTAATAAALKGLCTFALDGACSSAFKLVEVHFPELRDPTLLMSIGFACSTRGGSDAEARELLVFIVNSLCVARLAGDVPKGEEPVVSRIVGRDRKTPGTPRALFKKKEFVEYIFHEALLMNKEVGGDVAVFKTPLHIPQKFAASGANGPVASRRASDSGGGADGVETLFAPPVAGHRNAVDVKTTAMIDLAQQELQNSTTGFVWHTYLAETSQGVDAKYRAFVAACTGGPITANPDEDANLGLSGISELGGEQRAELQKLQEQLKQLRRTTVKFVSLPSVGGASGAEYAAAQMQSLWGALSLGHRFGRKKNDVRAFILSADSFPPSVVKQGAKARVNEQVACGGANFKRAIEFFLQKRQEDDALIFLDGRGRANRRVIESFDAKLESGGTRAHVRCWFVREQPAKKVGPRSAARASSYTKNNRGAAIFSMPLEGPPRKVLHRAEFNACGESSTADASHSGVPELFHDRIHVNARGILDRIRVIDRRFSELLRMDHETRMSTLGAASCAGVDGKQPRLQGGVKPLSLWQALVENHKAPHVVDFTPGSGALAVAAPGAIECEGIAANDARRDWLDSIVHRCAMHKAGHEEEYAEQLGGDAEFAEKASKYFSGAMMEAKRLWMPAAGDGEDEEEGGGASSDDE